jgi:hypothetical protein
MSVTQVDTTFGGKLMSASGLGVWGHAAPGAQPGAITSPTNAGVAPAGTAATNVTPYGYASAAQADAVRAAVGVLITDMGNMKTAVDAIRAALTGAGLTA